MNANEVVKFLNTLRHFVSGYWRGRIDQMIQQLGGTVREDKQG
jgi:hypothetical protein